MCDVQVPMLHDHHPDHEGRYHSAKICISDDTVPHTGSHYPTIQSYSSKSTNFFLGEQI